MAAMVSLGVQAGSDWVPPTVPQGESVVAGTDYYMYNVGAGRYANGGECWGTQACASTTATTIRLEAVGDDYYIRTLNNTKYIFRTNSDGWVGDGQKATFYDGNGASDNAKWTLTHLGDNKYTLTVPTTITSAGGYVEGECLGVQTNHATGFTTGETWGLYYDVVFANNEDNCTWVFLTDESFKIFDAKVSYAAKRATVLGFADNTSAYTDEVGAAETLRNAVYAQDDIVDAATTAAAINDATSAISAAGNTFLENVIITAGIDITNAWITNPAPGISGNLTGWENSGSPSLQYQLYEYWQVSAGTTKQTLSNLPKGAYQLTAIAYTRDNMTATLYAGDNTTSLVGCGSVNDRNGGNNWIAQGNGVNNLSFTLDAATASLEIGLIADNTTEDYWMCWRSFSLTYYGDPINLSKAALAEAVANAKTLEGTIPTSAYNALNTIVSANNTNWSTVEECEEATETINTAISTATALKPNYAAYKTLKANADALVAVANDNATANGTLATAISTAATNVETKTTAEDIAAVSATLKSAMITYVGAANPTDDAKFNLTFMLTNPNLESLPTWTGAAGWHTDQPDGNSQVMTNGNATSEDGTKTAFYEYWRNPAAANNLFALYQKVTLPVGTYNMSCYAFSQDDDTHVNHPNGVYFYANEVQGSPVNTARLSEAKIEFINSEEQEVKIGLKTITGNENKWMGIGYVELYKVAPNTQEYNINATTTNHASVVVKVNGEVATKALALEPVTMTVTLDDGCVLSSLTAKYSDNGNDIAIDVADMGNGEYSFQMPAFDVNVEIVAIVDKSALASAIEAANAVSEGSVPTALFTPFSSALTTATNVNDNADATVAEVAQAKSALTAATEAAVATQASYADYKAMTPKVAAMTSVEGYTETTSGAATTLTNAINTANTDVEAATDAAGVKAQIDAVKSAALTFLSSVRSDGAHPFDITFLISNPDFATDATTGWTYDKAPGYGHSAGEFYQTTFDFNQTISGLPKGNYELKVQAFQRPGWAGDVYSDYMVGNDNVTAEIYINEGSTSVQNICASAQNTAKLGEADGEGNWPDWPADSRLGSEGAYKYVPNSMEGASLYFAAGLYDNSVLVAVEGDLKFGFRSSTMNTGYWIIFDNFRLYFYGQSINVAMDEAQAFSALADIEGANVTMARTSKVGFNTVALPFDLTEAQVKEVFGDEAEVYSYSDEGNANNTTVNFNKTTTAITA